MRKPIFTLLFTLAILLGNGDVRAQTTLSKQKSCQPSTDEILSLIKSAFDAAPIVEKVLIAGEVKGGAQYLSIPEEQPLTLAMAIAMMGGMRKEGRSTFNLRNSTISQLCNSTISQ